jgi:phosphomannomutase
MIIGYDPRQDNVRNVKETARIFAAHNIPVKIIVAEPTPTPVLAYLANSGLLEPGREVFGTVNFTASHNPGKYNGYKPGAGDGGLADDDVANEIARLANEAEDYRSMDYEEAKEQGLITEIDPEDAVTIYTNYVIGKLKANGMWEKIAERIKGDPKYKIMVNPMQGTSVIYNQAILDAMAKEAGRNDFYEMVNTNNKDPEFKDVNGAPNPTLEKSIAGFVKQVIKYFKKGFKVSGLMNDGDADRFGWVENDGATFTADQIIGMLTAYIGDKKVKDGIDKNKLYVIVTVATSGFAKAIARNRGFNVIETAVGFKWIIKAIKELLKKEKDAVIILGGESSAHLGLEDMLSWDDGIMVTWYLLGVSAEKGSLSAYKKELEKQLNEKYVTKEEALELTEELKVKARALISSAATEEGRSKIAQRVKEIAAEKGYRQELAGFDLTDGLKVMFKNGEMSENGDWFLVRPSGTEPLARDYNESVIKPEEEQDRNDILKSIAMALLGIEEKQAEAEGVLSIEDSTVDSGDKPAGSSGIGRRILPRAVIAGARVTKGMRFMRRAVSPAGFVKTAKDAAIDAAPARKCRLAAETIASA